jgi:hypothetical protein
MVIFHRIIFLFSWLESIELMIDSPICNNLRFWAVSGFLIMEFIKAIFISFGILAVSVGILHFILKKLFKNYDTKMVWLWFLFVVTWIDLIGVYMSWWRII